MNQTKICTGCKKELPATTKYFNKHKRGRFGLQSRCKECVKEYKAKNKAKIKAQLKEYHKRTYISIKKPVNKEVLLEQNKTMKVCPACGKNLLLNEKNWYVNKQRPCGFRSPCKACIKEKQNKWNQEHMEVMKESQKKYRDKQRGKPPRKVKEGTKKDYDPIDFYDDYMFDSDDIETFF